MALIKMKTTNIATSLYSEMKKYSRTKSVFYQSVSPVDIKKLDTKIKKALMDNPKIAYQKDSEGVPFILTCVDCGMKESVKWILSEKSIDKTIFVDRAGENIATYAFKAGLEDLLEYCITCAPELLEQRDGNGISVQKRIDIKRKEEELSRR